MSDAATLVRRYYAEVWNRADEDAARAILDPAFRFRGSLGAERQGPEGFIDYMRAVHAALGHYTCTIEELIAAGDRAAARMRFEGLHRGAFFGVAPSGRQISWEGAAFFETGGGRVRSLWVLGDLDAVRRQLAVPAGSSFEGSA